LFTVGIFRTPLPPGETLKFCEGARGAIAGGPMLGEAKHSGTNRNSETDGKMIRIGRTVATSPELVVHAARKAGDRG
jgi:hypothetical protein